MNECEKYKGLLTGLADQELTPEETIEVNEHLIRCDSCRKDYDEHLKTTGRLENLAMQEPHDDLMEQLWRTPYGWFAKNAGLLLVIFGYLTLLLYGAYEAITDVSEAVVPRLALAAVTIGFVMLLVIVIIDRLRTFKSDPYKEIKR